jgi:cation-transporting P-type ATPase E
VSSAAPTPAVRAVGGQTGAPRGLTAAQVDERVRRGDVNDVPLGPSRTVGDIVRANVFTRFNFLLGALLVLILLVAPPQDGLFGIVLVVNAGIGIVQELRAKRTLEQLAVLSAPRVRVVRDGEVHEIAVGEIVRDDVIRLAPGDQVVVDGDVLAAEHLEVDESLLTGESDPVAKHPGDLCRSGTFVVAGTGYQWATRIGREAYATELAEQARRFTLVASELRHGIDWILRAVSWLIVPTMALVFYSQLTTELGVRSALASSVAGVVGMVPQGLVLLTSLAFAVAVLRLGKRQVVVQELPAVEGLARVDTVCLDKTGTLTVGQLAVTDLELLTHDHDEGAVAAVLGALAASDPSPNATLRAVANAYPAPEGWTPADARPFSSARKYAAVDFGARGTWVLGAPEVVLRRHPGVLHRSEEIARTGHRVLVLATSDGLPDAAGTPDTDPIALVVLGDDLRPDAAEIVAYFAAQGVAIKIISGDHPRTVGALAERAGVPGADGAAMDARDLPDDPEALADVMAAHVVFGRVAPEQKQQMVAALQARGHVVAMTGDGVNDVLALKAADLGIAMGSGSAATRSVAQLVLLDSDFAVMPTIVDEGRRVIANIERVANLFVTKTVYAFLLAVVIGIAGVAFPFLPRHLTLVGSLTIGIPGFLLAMEPTARRYRRGFIGRVLRFAIPTGTVAATATLAAYWLARDEATTLIESRTIATLTLMAIGGFALALVSRPLTPVRRAMLAGMFGAFVLVLAAPAGRVFFEFDLPRPVVVLAAIGIVAITGAAMYAWLKTVGWLATIDLPAVAEATTSAVASSSRAISIAFDRLFRGRPPPDD